MRRLVARSGTLSPAPSTPARAPWGEPDAASARVQLDRLGLRIGQRIAYVFDFGDEWRVRLTLVEIRPAGAEPCPPILERRGEAPPQYGYDDEELAEAG